jgi:hypothetical protein
MKLKEEVPANAIGTGNIANIEPLLFRAAGVKKLLNKATKLLKREYGNGSKSS